MYAEVLGSLMDAARTKYSGTLAGNSWFLLQDSAPASLSLVVKKYLAKYNVTALKHTPYFPGLSPPDLFLFLRLKCVLCGQ
jgi:hypothetical protein